MRGSNVTAGPISGISDRPIVALVGGNRPPDPPNILEVPNQPAASRRSAAMRWSTGGCE